MPSAGRRGAQRERTEWFANRGVFQPSTEQDGGRQTRSSRHLEAVQILMAEDEFTRLLAELNGAFTPATPLQSRELFAGRIDQIQAVVEGITEPGRHVILYGERGVGKTSLANTIGQIQISVGVKTITPNVVKVTAVSGDTYATIWQKILRRLSIPAKQSSPGIGDRTRVELVPVANLISGEASPDEVVALLQHLGLSCVFIVDEYDSVTDGRAKTQLADTLKVLSDNLPSVTVVLVGVSRTIEELIGHHPSVHRCLKEVRVPRMDTREMDEILDKGLEKLGMDIDPEPRNKIKEFAAGFPHYVHLMAKYSALHAIRRRSKRITDTDFVASVEDALEEAHESIRQSYQRATATTRVGTLYEPLLQACAEVGKNGHGTFRPADLLSILDRILQRSVAITSIYTPLSALCGETRGRILERAGPRYRFSDPLMEAYIMLRSFRGPR